MREDGASPYEVVKVGRISVVRPRDFGNQQIGEKEKWIYNAKKEPGLDDVME